LGTAELSHRTGTSPIRVPASTYRLQLNRSFTFDDAWRAAEYLDHLGVSACYTSPFLKARPGSLHGYDITDHSHINPEIGDLQSFRRFAAELNHRQMGLVVDVVPNHMCITDPSNRWWWDVLENGPSSPFARYFDIDWNPPKPELVNKVLLPFLGDQFGNVLEAQEIKVVYEAGALFVDFHGTSLPAAPRAFALLLEPALAILRDRLGQTDPGVIELESILTAVYYLPPQTETDETRIRERYREKEVIKRRMATLVESNETVRQALLDCLQQLNGYRGNPGSFDALERFLSEQVYRLSFWRVAADEINYRRFFDINELAAIRVEDQEVFMPVHAILLDLVREGWVTGLRIDHPDGLFDPLHYFRDLQAACREALLSGPGAAAAVPGGRLYVVAEKILVGNEELRPAWEIDGTVGYEFLNQLNGLFVDRSRKRAFERIYRRFTGWLDSYDDLIYESKRLMLQVSMSSELNVLARRLDRISEQHRGSRDFTLENLRDALREVLTCFPVYRVYVTPEATRPDEEDRRHIRTAVRIAKLRNPAMSGSVFDFIESLLLLKDPEGLGEAQSAERRLFVMRFQQLTGPVMAKGLEDTAFYRYFPLASLNEVGSDLRQFGTSVASFHSRNISRQKTWPNSMLATSTHDTKRSEDVRARINVLSEIPSEWYRALRSWMQVNRQCKVSAGGLLAPSANEEYLLYQTLLGTWPLEQMSRDEHSAYAGRIQRYMEKALREAKLHTSWVNPNAEYEAAVREFVDALLRPAPGNRFLAEFIPFQQQIAKAGMLNSLSQVLLKIASPGVPDFYQGNEVWDFSLADPDNRRPVDFAAHSRLLSTLCAESKEGDTPALLDRLYRSPEDGALKLYVTSRALRFRREHPALLLRGRYHPLKVIGRRHKHVIAFSRILGGDRVIAAAGRFFAGFLAQNGWPLPPHLWQETDLLLGDRPGANRFRDVFTQGEIAAVRSPGGWTLPVSEVFRHLPLALLHAVPEKARV
jgi:(1->4)-alpha-D-glucan 1-alpha-D-glucosylmutase